MVIWNRKKISEVADVIGGGTPSTNKFEYWEGNIPWITPKDLSGYNKRYISNGSRNISQLGLQNSSARILPKGSVLLTSRAPIGYIAIAEQEVCTNQGFKSLVLKEGYNSEFFYYLLKNNIEYIKNMSSGSTFSEISGTQVKNLEFEIPPLETQRKIAKVLSALDDKIELNNKINENLEQQAQAIFKEYISNNKTNALLENILIEMPKSKIKVGDAKNKKGEYPFFTSGQAVLEYNEYLVDDRNIFLNTGGTADVKFYIGKAAYSTDTWCIKGKDGFTDMIYLILHNMIDELDNSFFEGSALKHLQKQKLKSLPIYIPQKNILFKFNKLVIPMFNKISENTKINKQLACLRDTLLPKLMNGEIDVDKIKI